MATPVILSINCSPVEAPDDAQVAFTDGVTWSVIAPFRRLTGLSNFAAMPVVACPIIDLSGVVGDDVVSKVMREYINRSGVRDLQKLIEACKTLGATVSQL